ncbi:MAG: hypothetical protein K9M07_07660 [Simkaniaceae bacterium]|nr:hypothetical protein [Simkaniaceae bacterium]
MAICLDAPCIVDPMDPDRSICSCRIVKTGEFTTLGGNGAVKTCKKGFWSGATLEESEKNIRAFRTHFSQNHGEGL